jgi:hypothetical protein
MSRRSGDEAANLMAAAFMIFLAALVVVVLIIVGTLVELVRIYDERAGAGSPIAQRLRWALAGLGITWGLALVAGLANEQLMIPALVVAAWSFLVFVVVVETLDLRESQREQEAFGDPGDLDTYLAALQSPGAGLAASPIVLDQGVP